MDIRMISKSYGVDALGNFWSFKYKVPVKLQGQLTNAGYRRVTSREDGIQKPISVHREVAKAFIPNPDNKPMVNHINGIKTDNRASNLEWVTAKENTRHAVKSGLWKAPTDEQYRINRNKAGQSSALFTAEEATEIIEMKDALNLTSRAIALLVGCDKGTILNLVNGTTRCFKDVVFEERLI